LVLSHEGSGVVEAVGTGANLIDETLRITGTFNGSIRPHVDIPPRSTCSWTAGSRSTP
jgi:hypothetical protein